MSEMLKRISRTEALLLLAASAEPRPPRTLLDLSGLGTPEDDTPPEVVKTHITRALGFLTACGYLSVQSGQIPLYTLTASGEAFADLLHADKRFTKRPHPVKGLTL